MRPGLAWMLEPCSDSWRMSRYCFGALLRDSHALTVLIIKHHAAASVRDITASDADLARRDTQPAIPDASWSTPAAALEVSQYPLCHSPGSQLGA